MISRLVEPASSGIVVSFYDQSASRARLVVSFYGQSAIVEPASFGCVVFNYGKCYNNNFKNGVFYLGICRCC